MDSLWILSCFLVSALKWILIVSQTPSVASSLYPRESQSREIKSLDGIWDFRISPPNDQEIGFREKWFAKPLEQTGEVMPMPVPSSYNDITQNRTIRDYVGWVWYDLKFRAPRRWLEDNRTVILRLDSVHYFAQVYINGQPVVNHTGGHLPFQTDDLSQRLNYDGLNLVTVAVNNTLTPFTVPQGNVEYKTDRNRYPEGFYEVELNFDFFNYAGIHRSVRLYAVPSTNINDVAVVTGVVLGTGVINYSVSYQTKSVPKYSAVQCYVDLYDKLGLKIVAQSKGCEGTLRVDGASLWWPITLDPNPGYQYLAKFILRNESETIDVYEQRVGIREVSLSKNAFLINGKPFYLTGFGKHEDSNIRGKGLDLPVIIKDMNLIKWIGANVFRTSHYPYSEELMDEADAQGIAVIDECPAVGLSSFNDVLLQQHLSAIREMIGRDKNRPSVIMWSIANEPRSALKASEDYFQQVVDFTKTLDMTRPVTAAINADHEKDNLGQFLDLLMINRYYAWYSDTGCVEVIKRQVVDEFEKWHQRYDKLVMISEYGADAVSGLHSDPSFVFTEDYQTEFMMNYFEAFDELRSRGYFVGELIWNFADFMTNQGVNRVYGNRKGIFTRERQPKAAARVLRCRYLSLAKVKLHSDAHMYCPSTPP